MQSGPFHVDWIADSGAGRNLTSIKALTQQGILSDVMKHVTQSQPVAFSTGNGVYTSSEVLNSHGSSFGNSSPYVMHDCPVARSLGELVNEGQRPFVWLPGELPCFLQSSDCSSASLQAPSTQTESRVTFRSSDFREAVNFGLAASSARAPAPPAEPPELDPASDDPFDELFEPPVEGKSGEQEIPDEPPDSKAARLLREAAGNEHRLAHYPKNPYCGICMQSRMYARRVSRQRDEPLLARGDLPPTEAFGDRIAADVVVITKTSSDDKEATVLVARDEHAGFIRAFPSVRKSTENVVRCLLQFIGKNADHGPTVIFKSDCAKELEGARLQMSWVAEPTLPNKWPHNSVF